jgi:hypothetical protein
MLQEHCWFLSADPWELRSISYYPEDLEDELVFSQHLMGLHYVVSVYLVDHGPEDRVLVELTTLLLVVSTLIDMLFHGLPFFFRRVHQPDLVTCIVFLSLGTLIFRLENR